MEIFGLLRSFSEICKAFTKPIENMSRIITEFADGSYLEYDRGAFDNWCVYLSRPNVARYAPKDYQYFKRLHEYSLTHGAKKVYDDFVSIYDKTTKTLSSEVLAFIKDLTKSYGTDEINVSIDFSIIYMGMVAEENKENTKLGKRVKRLGVYQVLIDEMDYNSAANFSRGKKWRELDEICKSKGF